jgi:hypothetical protein
MPLVWSPGLTVQAHGLLNHSSTLLDSLTIGAHASRHLSGGGDALSITNAEVAANAAIAQSKLALTANPGAHASRHASGGADALSGLSRSQISDFGAPGELILLRVYGFGFMSGDTSFSNTTYGELTNYSRGKAPSTFPSLTGTTTVAKWAALIHQDNTGQYVYAKLYNLTDSKDVPNSEISTYQDGSCYNKNLVESGELAISDIAGKVLTPYVRVTGGSGNANQFWRLNVYAKL